MTLNYADPREAMAALFRALDRCPDLHAVITYPNADPRGRSLIPLIDAYQAAHPQKVVAVKNLGTQRYLSLMALADLVLGNSSSGLIEAPSFRVATVNIGGRQKGRLRAASVIDCDDSESGILEAIKRARSDAFRQTLAQVENPFWRDGKAASHIIAQLATYALDELTQKPFFDLGR
jgi:UDP-N-acetylglucosamine 2-epimerase